MTLPISFAMLVLVLLAGAAAQAGEGHDHGAAAPAVAAAALPRFAAVSETFELVGVLEGQRLTLYLDRAADNSPVTEAGIELEIGGARYVATKQGTDAFAVQLPAAPAPGVLPITATVTAGPETDLLAGELDLHAAEHAHDDGPGRWRPLAFWAAGGVAALLALGLVARRWWRAQPTRIGGAA